MASRVILALTVVWLALSMPFARGDDATPRKDQAPSLRLPSGPEQMARDLLEAMKQGDAETFLRLLDVRALYKQSRRREGLIDYIRFAAEVRRAIEAEFKDGPVKEFEYETEGEGPIVTVRTRYGPDGEWREHPVEFVQAGDKTRITPKGMRAFDFGYGPRGPVARTDKGGSAEVAVRAMLEAAKARDVETLFDYIDLEGIYRNMLPEEMRDQMSFEEFKEETIKAAKEAADEDRDEKFGYRDLKVTEEGDTATVKVETTEDGKEWKENTVQLKKTDGVWKLTPEGLVELAD